MGVTRVGLDGLGVDHRGGTCVINPLGTAMHTMDHKPGIHTCTIDLDKIRDEITENHVVE